MDYMSDKDVEAEARRILGECGIGDDELAVLRVSMALMLAYATGARDAARARRSEADG